jgi:glycine/D-amino acid oxidase-like deaminating enzyme
MSSPWSPPRFEPRPLAGDASADVCVIGAGLAGLLVAYRLLESGRSVIVLDQSGVGAGESGRTTAHVTAVLDRSYRELRAMHGPAAARMLAQSHTAAIDFLEQVASHEEIACDFRRIDGFLYRSAGDCDADVTREALVREQRAARAAGLDCSFVDCLPLPVPTGPALRFENQAELDPTRLMSGVARGVIERRGRILAPVRVVGIERGSPRRVRCSGGQVVSAKYVVVATNTPINDVVSIHTKQAAYRTYAIARPIASDALAPGLYWDMDEPYHFVRTALVLDGTALLIAGGEDHKVGQESDPERRWERLESWVQQHFPGAGNTAFRWSGQVLEPADGVGFVGLNPGDEDVYVVTGHSGNGTTYAAIAAMLIADLIDERDNPWWELYDPARKPASPRALARFARENANVAEHYADWLSPGTAGHTGEIPRGQGAVVRRGVHKLAVYVDGDGRIHERNARCPHLGCVVAWNDAEKSWDCPCHGSRFDALGRVLCGPAVRDLEEAPRRAPAPSAHARR